MNNLSLIDIKKAFENQVKIGRFIQGVYRSKFEIVKFIKCNPENNKYTVKLDILSDHGINNFGGYNPIKEKFDTEYIFNESTLKKTENVNFFLNCKIKNYKIKVLHHYIKEDLFCNEHGNVVLRQQVYDYNGIVKSSNSIIIDIIEI